MTSSAAVDTGWPERAGALVDVLTELGKLHDPAWRAAFAAVPRHRYVPRFWTQSPAGEWRETDTAIAPPDEWLPRVYSNTVLISALRNDSSGTRVRSSSSQPGLMARMLEALQIQTGQRVLEIGTGTGYNAALMCHRLGDRNVFSVDVEADLVAAACARLAASGYRPTVESGDGSAGLPAHAPFDRIIATCAVPRVPRAWVEQLAVDGQVLTDLKIAHGAGSLVRLHRIGPGRAEGRFDPVYAAFMDLHPATRPVPIPRAPGGAVTGRRETVLDPRTPWNSMIVWFLAAFDIGPSVSIGYTGIDTTRPPTAVRVATADGSWAEVILEARPNGKRDVVEGGPRALWRLVEQAHTQWQRLGEPGWERFGLTVTAEAQTVWLDDPSSGTEWPLLPGR